MYTGGRAIEIRNIPKVTSHFARAVGTNISDSSIIATNVAHGADAIGQSGPHNWRDADRLMDPSCEVVKHRVERDHVDVIFKLVTEHIGR